MASMVIPELDITWFKDDKRLKELKKSCDLAKWKTDVEALDNSFKTLKEFVSTDHFSKKTDWTPDTKLVFLGKIYSEFSTEKQKFMDLMPSITSMMKTKAQEELLAQQKRILNGLIKALELWTTNNSAFKGIVKISELLITKVSFVEYGKLEDKQRSILQSQAELKREINALIGQMDRVSKIRQLFQRFTHRLEENRMLQQQKRRLIKPLLLTFQNEEPDERAQEKDLLCWLSCLNEREQQNARDEQNQLVHQNFEDHLPVASRKDEERVENVEITMILSDNENEDAEPVAGQGNAGAIEGTPAADAPTEDTNPNVGAADVSVVSPQKAFPITEEPEDIMGSARKLLGSIPSSRSSRRRVELEAQIFEEQTEAQIKRKELELDLRRKQRQDDHDREELELEELKRTKELELKNKKLEILERVSSRSRASSAAHSDLGKVTSTRDWLESFRNCFSYPTEDQFERKPDINTTREDSTLFPQTKNDTKPEKKLETSVCTAYRTDDSREHSAENTDTIEGTATVARPSSDIINTEQYSCCNVTNETTETGFGQTRRRSS